jgi:hypothetical protein
MGWLRCANNINMKQILFILFIFLGYTSFGQVYQNYPQSMKTPRVRVDSVLSLPLGIERTRNISGGQDTGQIRYNKADSSVYIYTGSQWAQITGGGSGVTVVAYGKNAGGDSTILLLSNGTRYAARDSIGSGGSGTPDTIIVKLPCYIIPAGTAGSTHDSLVCPIDSLIAAAGIGGISQLGTPAYGLTRTNDSTYIVDTTSIASKTYVDNKDALKVNISDTNAMLLPYLRSAIATATYLDKTASQTAWFVYGNHTSGSAAATFAKMNINSISATGTPSSANFLRGDGAWIAGALSPWSYTGSDIYYSAGKVGIGITAPTTMLQLSSTTADGISLYNPTAATAGVGKPSSTLIFSSNAWNTTTTTSQQVDHRFYVDGGSANAATIGTLYFQRQVNGGGYSTLFSINAANNITFVGQNLTGINAITQSGSGSHTFNGSITITRNTIYGNVEGVVLNSGGANAGNVAASSTRMYYTTQYWNGAASIAAPYFYELAVPTSTTTSEWRVVTPTVTAIQAKNTGEVGIGNAAATSAKLDVASTTQGVLIPRMTTTQKNAISSPAEGLMVYDLTLHKLCVYTGSAWETVTSL